MKGKKLILVLVLLVLCLAAYFGIRQMDLDESGSEEQETIYISQTEGDSITVFSFVSGGETLSFTKDGETWTYDGDGTVDLNQTSITSMVSMLEEITADSRLDEPEALSEYGLDAPSNTISFTGADGTKTLLIGNENEAAGGYYAMLDGESTVYLISSSLPDKFSCTLDTLEETEEETTTEAAAETTAETTEDQSAEESGGDSGEQTE